MAQRLAAALGLFVLVVITAIVTQGMSTSAKDFAGTLLVAGVVLPFLAVGAGMYRTMTRDATPPRTRRERYPEFWELPQATKPVIDVPWRDANEEIEGASRELQRG